MFSFDGHQSRCRRLPGGKDELLLQDSEVECCYAIDRARRVVRVLAGRRRPSLRGVLLRLLREYATQGFCRRAGLQLHRAALTARGCVLAIVGPHRAGKTSLLLHPTLTRQDMDDVLKAF